MNVIAKEWLALAPADRYLKIRRAFVETQIKHKRD